MTINNTPRRTRRTLGHGPGGNGNGNGNGRGHDRQTVGERLRDAREVRGLDLYRVERDTKIRHKYLVALEAGDYADLPGDVYARGFLRNYATYLGLDPDEVIEEWRGEFSAVPVAPPGAPILGAPRAMVLPRRRLMLQTSHMVLIAVVLVVAVVAVYFGYQVSRFLSVPTLAVGCPGGPTVSSSGLVLAPTTAAPTAGGTGGTASSSGGPACSVDSSNRVIHITAAIGATTYYLSGSATAGSTVSIRSGIQEAKTVSVDDGGKWSYQAVLAPGQNQFTITAQNIDTNHSSKEFVVYVYVPSPTPTPSTPVVAFNTPADGASLTDSNVVVTGSSTNVSDVCLAVAYLGLPPAPGATLAPGAYSSSSPVATARSTSTPAPTPTPKAGASAGASTAPSQGPLCTAIMTNGDWSFGLTLQPGVWRVSATGEDQQGRKSTAVTRTVSIPYANVVVEIKVVSPGSNAWVKWYRDGTAMGQNTWPDGWSTTVSAKKSVCIQSPKPTVVQLTVNGVPMGFMSALGGKAVLIDSSHAPKGVAGC